MKESSSNMNNIIFDITPFTLLDYPNKIACIVWIPKCNLRCSYCHNKMMWSASGVYNEKYLFDFLDKRIDKLDAVVFSGGECTLCENIVDICRRVKDMGFLVKIDTNGINYNIIKELVDNKLVDCIALDYKTTKEKFHLFGNEDFFEKYEKTLDFLIHSDVKLIIRNTFDDSFMTEEDIHNIECDIARRGYRGKLIRQKVRPIEGEQVL